MNRGNSITYLAEARVKGEWIKFGIKDADRVSHMCVVGKMGSGRAAFLTNMALQDIARGLGVLILDGAGNLTQSLLERVPKEAQARLMVIDPSDGEHPFSWNVLEDFRTLQEAEALAKLSETLAEMYQTPTGHLIEFVAAYMLADKEANPLLLYELVSDVKVRDKIFPQKEDARTHFEWLLSTSADEAASITEHGRYLAKDVLMRNLLGQKTSKFSLKELQKGGIVVVDFSRIRMFPTRIAPLVRLFLHAAGVFASAEAPLSIYMHDALRYLSLEDLERTLLLRSVMLTISDTARNEEESPMREKLLQRVGSVISFSPHETDVPLVERVFYPYVSPEELEKLEPGQLTIALAIDAVRSRPFFGRVYGSAERSGTSPLDLALASRDKFTSARLAVDKMFRPKTKAEEETKKSEDPGSFSDAFRSIFTKRAGDGAQPKDAKAAGAAPAAPAKPPEVKTTAAEQKPAPKAEEKKSEIPEEELKKMLHVKHKPS